MAYQVVDQLAAGEQNKEGSHRMELQVWQPDWRGQRLSPDDVMIEFRHALDQSALREEEAAAARHATRRWLVRGSARAAIVAIWAGLASWLMPAFQMAPLPAAAWLPVISFAGASAGLLAVVVIFERAGLFRPGGKKLALNHDQASAMDSAFK
jgi:hypothetical protein